MLRTQGLLFGALLLAGAGFYQPVDYDNTKSRYMLLSSIVDEGRLFIDSHEQYTIDKAYADGHFYSIKPIGLPFLSAPFYWALRKAFLGPATLLSDPTILADPAAKYLVRVFIVSVPFALLGLILLQFLIDLGAGPRAALWTVIAYSFGTIALNHAALYSGHQTAAFFLFLSFALLVRASKKDASGGTRSTALSALAGLCAALSVLCDYIAVVYVVVLAVYLLSSNLPLRAKLSFFAAALPFASLLLSYNLACFGSPWSTGYSHLAFAPFRQYTDQGLFGIAWPRPAILFGLTLSVARGLFFISPILLFSLAGYTFLRRRPELRREFAVLCAIPVVGLILYSGYPAGWHGGWTFGPRYLVDVLPFLAAPMALTADGGPWFLVLLTLSVFQVAAAQIGLPHVPSELKNPLADFIFPLLREGAGALTLFGAGREGDIAGGLSELALAGGLAAGGFIGLPALRPRRLPRVWRAAMGAWAGVVVLALLFVRTSDRAVLGRCRGLVLRDAATALHSQRLYDAGTRELAER